MNVYTVTLNSGITKRYPGGVPAYRNVFETQDEAVKVADSFACHKGTLIEVRDESGDVVHQRKG